MQEMTLTGQVVRSQVVQRRWMTRSVSFLSHSTFSTMNYLPSLGRSLVGTFGCTVTLRIATAAAACTNNAHFVFFYG